MFLTIFCLVCSVTEDNASSDPDASNRDNENNHDDRHREEMADALTNDDDSPEPEDLAGLAEQKRKKRKRAKTAATAAAAHEQAPPSTLHASPKVLARSDLYHDGTAMPTRKKHITCTQPS